MSTAVNDVPMAMQRSSAPTITDVAQRAGVSMKTVSRVLNDEPNVQPQMRERMFLIARREELQRLHATLSERAPR